MKIFVKTATFFLFLFLIAAASFFAYYFFITAPYSLDASKLKSVQDNVAVYDNAGNLLTFCSSTGENGVKVENLPKHTVNAFVCAEDKSFFSHHGLNYKRMVAALFNNLSSRSFKEGASTISQQLIKNTQLSAEKTIQRKLIEIKLAKQLEKKYSKEEIMEMYLNTIYFGHSAFGLESAARFYFDRPAAELTLSQSAILAGMIKSPNNYSPLKNPENCLKRRNFILKVMHEEGYVSSLEKARAQKEKLPQEGHEKQGFAECYFNSVFNELENAIGEDVYGGLKIYTYMDKNVQKELENQAENAPDTDKSFCVIDNGLRGVKAFYSTVGQARRLPGSTIKPLLVYAPALQENLIAPATPILDEKINYAGYSPKNYGDEYHGYVSAREALANSYNVPAVKTLNALGVKKGVSYLEKMNLSVEKEDFSLALALGGMQKGYPLTDLVNAYSTFANNGVFQPCAFIKKITDLKGNVVYERKTSRNKVFNEDTVTLLNDMLISTAKTGTAKKMKNTTYEVCAKTGTCGNEAGNTDAYCIAYTSCDSIGVWLGNADNHPMQNITGGGLPTNINLNIQEYLYKNNLPPPFKKSPSVVECTLDQYEYNKNHALILCDENAPVQEKTLRELFKKSYKPKKQSVRFSHPSLKNIGIFCKNKGVLIELCQTGYLTIVINREENGKFETVYRGNCTESFLDESVEEGKIYCYSITPYYKEFVGKTVILPKIKYTKKDLAEKIQQGLSS